MDDQKQQAIDKLKAASNVLVTVSADPSVDQLAACIGLTLLLNKLDKHATAVFSGEVPSTIEFLKPEETLEKTTDSLRDFIISLDKAKADKLRYKVEDTVVRIFITPYREQIDEKDLVFSQGDFNVDVIVALGVRNQDELDKAITAHGRILHDAVVIGVNTTAEATLGSINWLELGASSLSEMVAGLPAQLGEGLLDGQIATALLTGVVAETKHFSNAKTTPQTMSVSANLLAAGANQQLVAEKLGDTIKTEATQPPTKAAEAADDKSLAIEHASKPAADLPDLPREATPDDTKKIVPEPRSNTAISHKPLEVSNVKAYGPDMDTRQPEPFTDPRMVTQPPRYGDVVKPLEGANIFDPAIDISQQPKPPAPLISRTDNPDTKPASPPSVSSVLNTSSNGPLPALDGNQTLSQLEAVVHAEEAADEDVDSARQAVESALGSADDPLEKLTKLDANAVSPDEVLPHYDANDNPQNETQLTPATQAAQPELPKLSLEAPAPASPNGFDMPLPFNPAAHEPAPLEMSPADQTFTMPLPPTISMAPPQTVPPTSVTTAPQGPPPPPVPPPMMPPGL